MTRNSILDAALIQAYRETHYRVLGNQPFTLRVDQYSAELAEAHRRCGVDCSAFVTACNPFGEPLSDAANTDRHADLGLNLSRRALRSIDGIGQHPFNPWPGEASYLVFGLSQGASEALGRAWTQNAIIWSAADAIPRLILLR